MTQFEMILTGYSIIIALCVARLLDGLRLHGLITPERESDRGSQSQDPSPKPQDPSPKTQDQNHWGSGPVRRPIERTPDREQKSRAATTPWGPVS